MTKLTHVDLLQFGSETVKKKKKKKKKFWYDVLHAWATLNTSFIITDPKGVQCF